MRIHLAGFITLVVVAWAGHRIGSRLSPDAIGMAVGMLFGIMAGVPTAIIVLAARRQSPTTYGQYLPPEEKPAPQITQQHTHYHYHAPPEERQTVDQFLAGTKQIE